MNYLMFVALSAVVLVTGCKPEPGPAGASGKNVDQPTTASTAYTCEMHPKVSQDKPGNCPECGMKLMPKK